MPLVAETLAAIARAEFPEDAYQGVLSPPRARAGGNQPALHHLLQEAVGKSRSRWTRLNSLDRKTRRPPFLQLCSAASDSASFSFGVATSALIFFTFFLLCNNKYISPRHLQVNNAVLVSST